MDQAELSLYALDSSRGLGAKIGQALGVRLAEQSEKEFEDGEYKSRAIGGVRGKDLFVIHSLHREPGQSPGEKLIRLLFFLGALADAAPARVTAVVPYLCYARQDRRAQANDALTTRYVARMFEAVGAQGVMAMDVHNIAAFQNAFRLPTEHIEASALFVAHFAALLREREIVVVAPDAGGIDRAERFRAALSGAVGRPIASGFVAKQRSESGLGSKHAFGQFAGRAAIVFDDMICTGATIVRAAQVCRDLGADSVYAAATHGVFAADAMRALADPVVDGVVVTNSVTPPGPDAGLAQPKLVVLDAAQLFADAIRVVHAGGLPYH